MKHFMQTFYSLKSNEKNVSPPLTQKWYPSNKNLIWRHSQTWGITLCILTASVHKTIISQ